jgi:uncharacterized protein
MSGADVLVADHAITYNYTRSTGPVIGAFLTGLRDRKVVGCSCRRSTTTR